MPNTVPAAVPGSPTPTRRAVLVGAPALAAASIVTGPVAASPPSLAQLIEAHRVAYQAHEEAVIARNEIEDALDEAREQNRIMVPLAVDEDGRGSCGFYEFGKVSIPEIRKEIERTHEHRRSIHCSPWAQRNFPDLAERVGAAIDASRDRALQAILDAQEEVKRRECEAGLPEAQARVDATAEDEMNARLDLVLYRPADAFEARAKADYMATAVPFVAGWCEGDDEFMRALLARLTA